MGKIYKCSACGQSANMELYDKACPNCGANRDKMSLSKDFTKGPQALIAGAIEFVKNKKNRPVLFVTTLILVFLLFQLCSEKQKKDENYTLYLEPIHEGNGVRFLIKTESKSKNEATTREYFDDIIDTIELSRKKISYAELKKNKFVYYPCESGKLPFKIRLKRGKNVTIIPENSTVTLDFEIISENAKCNPLVLYPIPTIQEKASCTHHFIWNGDKSLLRISWEGENGNYENQLIKKSSELGKIYSVWYYAVGFENEKYPVAINGSPIKPCLLSLNKDSIHQEFITTFNTLGMNPNNSKSAELTFLVKNKCSDNVTVILNGQEESSIEGLFQIMKSVADEAIAIGKRTTFICKTVTLANDNKATKVEIESVTK